MLKRLFFPSFFLVISLSGLGIILSPGEKEFDILIIRGKIVDGTGNPWFYGDIGIIGETIAEVGNLKGKSSKKVINAQGMVVAPGFIDMHTHCDRGLSKPPTNSNLNYLTQGVTTVVVGNCGSGTYKIRETKERWEKQGIGTNAVPLVGFGTVRRDVLGEENRLPTEEELERMKALLRKGMEEGAWGMSTGLQYIPDRYASTEEIIALTRIVGEYGGIYTSHQRDEEEKLVEAVKETIRIGRETGVPVNAAHLKCAGKSNWGLMKEALRVINEARAAGIEITADMYPYDKAATTPLIAIFNIPKEMEPFPEIEKKIQAATSSQEIKDLIELATDELVKALSEREKREKIKKLTLEGDPEKVNWVKTWGWHNFTIVSAKKNTSLIGKIFSDLAQEEKRDAFEIAADLLIEEKNDLIISLATMSEEEMELAMREEWLMFSSDGDAIPFGEGSVHPRNYGSFPRVLGKYVREEKILSLEEAVRKMTSLPAHLLRLKRRGMILEGFKADLVIFDPQKIRDNATYLNPHQYSGGVAYVLVNGELAIEEYEFTRSLKGKVLLLTENK